MKNRLGIFAFYDAYGIADKYVEELLKGILPQLGKLVVIVNGVVTDESKLRLEKYADELYIRKNIGYDGGAYKDAFLTFLKYEKWEFWDEIILFNDTFFAPIFPWETIFCEMEKTLVDFGGLTRHIGGASTRNRRNYCRPYSGIFFDNHKKNVYELRFLEVLGKFRVSDFLSGGNRKF